MESFYSDDLNAIQMEDLFFPLENDYALSTPFLGSIEPPASVGSLLKEEMENRQNLTPGSSTSTDDLRETSRFQFPPSSAGDDCFQPVTLCHVTRRADDRLELREEIFFPEKRTLALFHINPEIEVVEPNPEETISTPGKVKWKETSTSSKINDGAGKGKKRHLGNKAAAGCSSAKEEDRKKRRKESNRRAAERYRTKLRASAIDAASEQKKLMDENQRLTDEVDLYKSHLVNVLRAIQYHQQQCSIPFLLPESILTQSDEHEGHVTQTASSSAESGFPQSDQQVSSFGHLQVLGLYARMNGGV